MKTMNSRGFTFVVCLAVCALGLSLIGCGGGGSSTPAGPTQGIIRIEITSTDSPAFQGHVFPGIGTYDRIQGRAYGLLDPNNPKNQVITDIALAETNANGMVEYETMFYILTPTDPSKRGKVLFEPPNRGGKQFGTFNQSGGANNVGDLATDAAAANSNTVPVTPATYPGFLFNKGYSTVWAAWDMEPGSIGGSNLSAKLPIAYNPDGSSIAGPVYEYLVAGNATTNCQNTYYNPVDDDTTKSTLTVRAHLTDIPTAVASARWRWNGPGECSGPGSLNGSSITLLDGSGDPENFTMHHIYELEYTAKDPYVATVGFAAMRDFVSYIRHYNRLAGNIQQIMVWTNSQPGRLMNDYIWLGFNEDLGGRKVFDGSLQYIGGGDGLGINYRFAQVGRTERNRQNHIAQLEGVFPFSYTTTTDAFTGKTDGRNVRCTATNTCPKIINLYSANEMWVKTASLATTHPNTGEDVVEPANVRNYQLAGAQHGNGVAPGNVGATATNQFPSTTVNPQPIYRALWMALEKWISDGTPPPDSVVPSVTLGTAVFVPTDDRSINDLGIGMVPLASLGFPDLVTPGLMDVSSMVVTVRNHWYFGVRYNEGILDFVPAIPTGKYYPTSVSKVDPIGNEIGGLRLPEIEAPLGTNAGWNIRSSAGSGKADGTDGAEGTGAFIPLALTDATKCAGDPRPSLEALYGPAGTVDDWKAEWLAQRMDAADALYAAGFLLPDDHANYETSGRMALTVGTNAHAACWHSYSWPASP